MSSDGPRGTSRRGFLRRAAFGAGAAATLPAWSLDRAGARKPIPFADLAERAGVASVEDEEFWELVKAQFPLDPDLILMNAANLCPSPYPVQEAVFRHTRDIDADASFQNRAKFDALREASRAALAEYLGAASDEIAITRNTSESNNTILNGLTLGAGDEVVIWDQNHPTNNISWDVRAERWGFTVKRVSTPPAARDAEELLAPFRAAMTDRTRVIAFSHISNASGVALPARELCAMARDAGAFSLVDGAQSFGAIRVDLHDMGCDAYTGSAHKWFVGPKEAGVLYVREDRVGELWASDVGVGWQGAVESGARKLDNLGQRDDGAVAAIGVTVGFHRAIGTALIEARVRALVAGIKAAMRERVPEVEFHTSDVADRSAGVLVVKLPLDDHAPLYRDLYEKHKIAGALRGGDLAGIRLCPHMYNTMAEVERVADTLAAAV